VAGPAHGSRPAAAPNRETVIRAELDLAALQANRKTGAAPTFRDRRRRVRLYREWPSHLGRKEERP
jgi:hypothetical protein